MTFHQLFLIFLELDGEGVVHECLHEEAHHEEAFASIVKNLSPHY